MGVDGVFRRGWYVLAQERQRRLAPVDAQPATGLMDVFLDGGLGQAQARRDLLVGQEGGQPEAFLLTWTENLGHRKLPFPNPC